MLAGEREELVAATRNLSVALTAVKEFVQENKGSLSRNITGLNRVAKVLVRQRGALDEILHVAPGALNNLALTYNPQAGTLDTRANFGESVNQLQLDPAAFLSGCEASVYSLPLPGGPDVGEDPMTIEVEFADVLDLVPQSTVKVNDVSVGKVTAIDLQGYQALVTLEVRNDVELPGNAVAELRQTSLLGEKFVELSAPEEGAITTKMKDGAT